jgi:ABC-2 type transport system ATP-binding protein
VKPPPSSASIRARGLVKSFGGVVAVDGLDLEAFPGRCLGLLGPNGAGKTTTIEMLEGLLEPDRGEIEILGLSWARDAMRIRESIGVQLQETLLPDKLRVAEVLRVFQSLYPAGRTVAEVLERIGLEEKRGAFTAELSGGQRQRLSLGCALVHRPRVLFLDEPTTGLDPQGRRRIWEVVEEFQEQGGTVLLTTHFMEEAERLADELMILDHGRCLQRGSPRELVASLGAESLLELVVASTDGGAPEPPQAALARLPEVLSVRCSQDRVQLGARSFERVLPPLLETLAAARLTLTDLEVRRPTLEDVFVSLTGRELREP